MALLLSVLGLFGTLSDAARQRRRELAIRIALGAQRWRVIAQVLGEGGRLACAGTLAGMLGSVVLSRWMTGITWGSGSPALWVWLAAPIVLAGVVAIASFLPARRALMVNPHDHARRQLPPTSCHIVQWRLPTELFEDFHQRRAFTYHLAGRF